MEIRLTSFFFLFITSIVSFGQITYVWNTGDGSWATSTNWLPPRTTPLANDQLIFNDAGTHLVNDVPTQTIGGLIITADTNVDFQASTTSKTLTVGNALIDDFTVDAGSAFSVLNNSGVLLNITIAVGSRASIGGSVTMHSGTFSVGNNLLHLHSSAIPIDRISGQFSIGSGGTIQFGGLSTLGGPTMVLPDNIFVSDPTVSSIVMNRTSGVILGNQSITVSGATIMTEGDLTTNSAGRIKFSSSATSPVETANSKIIGYAEMLSRAVGTGVLNFLGFELVSGATTDIGIVSMLRKTGVSGINIFNGNKSIASTWDIVSSVEPVVGGRLVSLLWYDDFDNGTNSSSQFQTYRFEGGPDWTNVGSLLSLQATTNPRISTPVLTTQLSGPWTIADENNALPISLIELEGTNQNGAVKLFWKTATEISGDYFGIQRSDDANENFHKIGKILAKGSSLIPTQYEFIDFNPNPGRNYYRLKMVDKDGTLEHSPIIAVNVEYEYSVSPISINPNPYYGGLFHIRKRITEAGWITIRNSQGITLLKVQQSTPELIFPVLQFPSGMYFIEFSNSNIRLSERLIIK